MTPLAKLLQASIALQVRSREDKLAWAADIKAVAFELYDLAGACPHGHPRNVECERCWLVHNTVGMLEEFCNREEARINREHAESNKLTKPDNHH